MNPGSPSTASRRSGLQVWRAKSVRLGGGSPQLDDPLPKLALTLKTAAYRLRRVLLRRAGGVSTRYAEFQTNASAKFIECHMICTEVGCP